MGALVDEPLADRDDLSVQRRRELRGEPLSPDANEAGTLVDVYFDAVAVVTEEPLLPRPARETKERVGQRRAERGTQAEPLLELPQHVHRQNVRFEQQLVVARGRAARAEQCG